MATTKYWMTDINTGAWAQMDGVEERDYWAAHGWTLEDGEPAAQDRVWLYHPETGGRQTLSREASEGFWAGVGWVPGAPPIPPDLTKDPALVDQPPARRATTKAAAGSDTKEK